MQHRFSRIFCTERKNRVGISESFSEKRQQFCAVFFSEIDPSSSGIDDVEVLIFCDMHRSRRNDRRSDFFCFAERISRFSQSFRILCRFIGPSDIFVFCAPRIGCAFCGIYRFFTCTALRFLRCLRAAGIFRRA